LRVLTTAAYAIPSPSVGRDVTGLRVAWPGGELGCFAPGQSVPASVQRYT